MQSNSKSNLHITFYDFFMWLTKTPTFCYKIWNTFQINWIHELISDSNFLSLSTLSKFATMFLIFETKFWWEEKNVELSNMCHKMKTKMLQSVWLWHFLISDARWPASWWHQSSESIVSVWPVDLSSHDLYTMVSFSRDDSCSHPNNTYTSI
jgi:hypothetical protein